MTMTKLAARLAAAATLLAFAAPAFPCGDAKQTSATNQPAPTVTPKDAVAKQTPAQQKAKGQGKTSSSAKKQATAAN